MLNSAKGSNPIFTPDVPWRPQWLCYSPHWTPQCGRQLGSWAVKSLLRCIQTTWWLGLCKEGEVRPEKKEQEESKEERSERRSVAATSRGVPCAAVQNHSQKTVQVPWEWWETIAGRVGARDAKIELPFSDIEIIVLFWQSSSTSPCRIRFSFMIEYLYNFNFSHYRIKASKTSIVSCLSY